jgi:hypothetical protein
MMGHRVLLAPKVLRGQPVTVVHPGHKALLDQQGHKVLQGLRVLKVLLVPKDLQGHKALRAQESPF